MALNRRRVIEEWERNKMKSLEKKRAILKRLKVE